MGMGPQYQTQSVFPLYPAMFQRLGPVPISKHRPKREQVKVYYIDAFTHARTVLRHGHTDTQNVHDSLTLACVCESALRPFLSTKLAVVSTLHFLKPVARWRPIHQNGGGGREKGEGVVWTGMNVGVPLECNCVTPHYRHPVAMEINKHLQVQCWNATVWLLGIWFPLPWKLRSTKWWP